MLIAALLMVLLFGAPTAFVAWVNSGDGATSATDPSPSATTQEPTREQTTPAQSPTAEATPKPLPVSGVVTGSCLPSGSIGYVCTPSGTVTASEDGFVRGTRDGQYLLIECSTQNCSATDVPKAQVPCVKGIGSTVFCVKLDDRERAFRAMQTLTYLCSRDDDDVACRARDNITVVEGGLHINSLPAVLATSEKGVLGAYPAQAPAGFKSYGSCEKGTDTIRCSSPADRIAPAGLNCTPDWNESTGVTTLTCIEPVGKMQETEVTVWCPGGDGTVYCHTREGGMYSNRWDCTLDTNGERKFVCRIGAA